VRLLDILNIQVNVIDVKLRYRDKEIETLATTSAVSAILMKIIEIANHAIWKDISSRSNREGSTHAGMLVRTFKVDLQLIWPKIAAAAKLGCKNRLPKMFVGRVATSARTEISANLVNRNKNN